MPRRVEPNFWLPSLGLLHLILEGIKGKHDDGPIGDLQVVRADLNPLLPHPGHFPRQVLRIYHSAYTQQVHRLRPEDARGQ